MGSAGREGRQSEKTFNEVWNCMRSLAVEVWMPRADDAEETTAYMKRKLDQMIAEMKAESFSNPGTTSIRRGLVESPVNTHGPFDEEKRMR